MPLRSFSSHLRKPRHQVTPQTLAISACCALQLATGQTACQASHLPVPRQDPSISYTLGTRLKYARGFMVMQGWQVQLQRIRTPSIQANVLCASFQYSPMASSSLDVNLASRPGSFRQLNAEQFVQKRARQAEKESLRSGISMQGSTWEPTLGWALARPCMMPAERFLPVSAICRRGFSAFPSQGEFSSTCRCCSFRRTRMAKEAYASETPFPDPRRRSEGSSLTWRSPRQRK